MAGRFDHGYEPLGSTEVENFLTSSLTVNTEIIVRRAEVVIR
jgi:hypothetical protein